MHSVFTIPELRSAVLAHVRDKPTLAAVAMTCHTLKDTALDALWYNLESLAPLALLLDQFRKSNHNGSVEWTLSHSSIGVSEWRIYQKYNHRVKRLRLRPRDPITIRRTTGRLSNAVFSAIPLSKPPSAELLPQLNSLFIDASPDELLYCLPYLSSNIKDLAVVTWPGSSSWNYLFSELKERVPAPKILNIRGRKTVENALALDDYLQGLDSLQDITLLASYLTPEILASLSQSRTLKNLSATLGTLPVIHQADQYSGLESLVKFDVSSKLEILEPLLCAKNWAPGLKDLRVVDWTFSTQVPTHESFFTSIATCRTQLTSLCLKLNVDPSVDDTLPISFQSLSPLLQCPNITTFSIRHHLPIPIEIAQLKSMLVSWHSLVHLSLTPDSRVNVDATAGLPLQSLELFSLHCPKIQHIGLLFDKSVPDPRFDHTPLSDLRVLNIGNSKVEDTCSAGLFLASLCGPSLRILWEDVKTHTTDPVPPPSSGAASDPKNPWEDVCRWFAGFVSMRRGVTDSVKKRLQDG